MKRRILGLALVAALIMPLQGCVEADLVRALQWKLYGQPGNFPSALKAKKGTPIEADIMTDVVVSIGGLDGTYDITVSLPGGPEIGSFSGTGKVKRGRFVTLKDKGSEGLFDTVGAMLGTALEAEVDVTKAKATVKTFQTPGGVEKHYDVTITFNADILSGPNTGGTIKGKLTTEGMFGPP